MPIVETREIQVRYCEDCKYFVDPDRCSHPLVLTENLVTRKAAAAFCGMARTAFGTATTCGPEGKYWREKEVVSIPAKRRLRWVFWVLR